MVTAAAIDPDRAHQCRGEQGLSHDFSTVGFVLGDGLAGPQPRGQYPPGDAEVLPVMGLLAALPGIKSGPGMLRLHTVAEPVGAAG
jgi:hypothetical protein